MTPGVALVTGGTAGIGAAVARRLVDEGWVVAITSQNSVSEGKALAAQLPRTRYMRADISDRLAVDQIVATVTEELGGIDLLVNNAGVNATIAHDDLEAVTSDQWRRILEVNVIGTWNMVTAAAPALRRAQGAIINITSLAGIRPMGTSIPYAVSKAALHHMTLLLARTLGPDIRVNGVAPGLVKTPRTGGWTQIQDDVRRTAPLGRTGAPEDVAEVVLSLAKAGYVTGEVITVDGGLHLI
ncbi:SDR family NAD(P)-dependent oxidoreductase [Streptomyces sp. NPDC055955]|uniref:SDR family NAD(P)-dependent oxidoreductase n=1 Tax=Streptomyces sp. NPDC055955 TaxID=3345665 RepID=UPI0035D77150